MWRTVFCLQCRKFKGSEAVRSRAGIIYQKFKTLFLFSGDATDNHEVIFLAILLTIPLTQGIMQGWI